MKIFIGFDSREAEAFSVCKHSLERHATDFLEIVPVKQSILRKNGLYTREFTEKNGIRYDNIDGKPFSTEFSFTRFLVPHLCNYQGFALFMDSDMLVTRDVKEVFDLKDPQYAVQCVKHRYEPTETVKMDGQLQQKYPRKNWSSFVLWNCSHPSNKCVTPAMVNNATGKFLHGFEWLDDDEIGSLPETWNFLVGHSKPANVHYTSGGPWFPDYQDVPYADLWREEQELLK